MGRLIEKVKVNNTQGEIQIEHTGNIFFIQIVFMDGVTSILKVYIE